MGRGVREGGGPGRQAREAEELRRGRGERDLAAEGLELRIPRDRERAPVKPLIVGGSR